MKHLDSISKILASTDQDMVASPNNPANYNLKEINMTIHEQIVQSFNNYVTEAQTFDEKGVKAAAARARKALGDLGKLTKERRKEIQEKKNNM